MYKVSVIIPTYNRLDRLKIALDSVWSQTYSNYEVIVIDDGSTDATRDFLESINKPQFYFYHQENKGPSAARNFAISQSNGDWIALLDSDDEWTNDKLQVQIDFIKNHPEYLWIQSEEIWIRNGIRVNPHKKHKKPSGEIFQSILSFCLVSPSAAIFQKKFFDELGGFDESLPVCEDYDLWLRMAQKSPFMTLKHFGTIKHGGHEDQLSHRHWGMDRFRVQSLEKILIQSQLTKSDELALLKELSRKCEILAKGFSKRNPNKKNTWEEKWQKYLKAQKDLMEERITTYVQ